MIFIDKNGDNREEVAEEEKKEKEQGDTCM